MTREINLKPSNSISKQTVVLKTKLMPQDITEILNAKKTSLFGSALRRPKPDEITIENPQLFLEQVILVSGNYDVNFNRNVSYTVKVNSDVKEVTIGNEKFPIADNSGVWKKMKQGMGITKQELKINVTERAVKYSTDSLYLDNHGLETDFPYSINSESIENYAQRALDINSEHIRKNEIDDDEIFSKLGQRFKDSVSSDIEIKQEDFVITEFLEIFVPIYETECYDKKRKVAIARIDAVTGTFL
ncbi:MAG: hypothetical protein GKS07_07525 [Nitrosopumilus sp.]|nr:MAG: hypothetical protein GKS07_07525 [Nitrosopumilus sp.]